jgi:hypothetical protein
VGGVRFRSDRRLSAERTSTITIIIITDVIVVAVTVAVVTSFTARSSEPQSWTATDGCCIVGALKKWWCMATGARRPPDGERARSTIVSRLIQQDGSASCRRPIMMQTRFHHASALERLGRTLRPGGRFV